MGVKNMSKEIETILNKIELPRMVRVRQTFDHEKLSDIPGEVRIQLEHSGMSSRILPGMSVAITAGSRGVANIAVILREIVRFCQEKGAKPFIIPAMGSHGGANAEGQREILTGYSVTEEFLNCPVLCTMDVRQIAVLENGDPVRIDAYAAEADGIIVVGRVKPHTLFHSRVESGLCKMMAIGLGKQIGAEECHKFGPHRLAEQVQRFGYAILDAAPVLGGVGIVENAYDETAVIRAFDRTEIRDGEPALLDEARKRMPRIPFHYCDLLIVDQIGKNISGDGMDPNITGKYIVEGLKGEPDSSRMVVLDITDESHGNGNGIGFADMTTQRAADKFDRAKTYPNAITSQIMDLTRIPPVFPNDRQCIQAGLKCVFGLLDHRHAKVIRIRNTMHVDEFEISEALMEEARLVSGMEILGEPYEFSFDEAGNLF